MALSVCWNRSVVKLRPAFIFQLAFYILLAITIGGIASRSYGAPPKFFIYKPLESNPQATQERWKKAGAPDEIAKALVDYERSPSMKTAIGVLKYFKWFASLSNQKRQALFDVNPKLFQSVDAAKFELALQTSRKLDGVDHNLRFGSSGERFLEWMKWAKTHDLDKMPPLNPSIQFKSDDDICHLPKPALLEKDPLAGEAINGARAAEVYRRITEAYGTPMYPEEVETNFLSPTKTYDVFVRGKYGPLQQIIWPSYLQAWVNSDPEKYNGIFAEERMRQWCLQKGVITTDLQDPTLPTMRFNEFVKDPERSKRTLPDFVKIDDLDVWIANNHRMIFQVHKGHTHSLGKYVLRMIAAYEDLNVKLPGDPGMIEKIKKMAQSVYRPTSDNEPSFYGGTDEIRKQLDQYCRQLVLDAHRQHIDALVAEIKKIRPQWGTKEAILKFANQVEQAGNDKKSRIYRLLNNLALTYANLDPDLQRKLRAEAAEAVQAAMNPAHGSRRTPDDVIRGILSKKLLELIDHADMSAKNLKDMALSFRRMRQNMGKLVNDELYHLADITLDELLVKVAKNEFTEKRWVIDQGHLVFKTIVKDPVEVEADLELFRNLAEAFGWDERKYAERLLEYFRGDVSEGIKYLQLLYRTFDPKFNRPVRVPVPDQDGNIVYREVYPSHMGNLGMLLFKSGIKGYSIWGDIQSGKQLFEHLRDMYGGGKSSAEIQALQARALSEFIGLVDYAEVFKAFGNIRQGFSWPFPTDTLATVASLSGGDIPLDENAFKQLAVSSLKDLCCAVAPDLAAVFVLYDITTWAYNKYVLSSAEDGITKLLVENGKWDFKRVGDPKYKDLKHPELVEICIPPDNDKQSSSSAPTCQKIIHGENYTELAKKMDRYKRGIKTLKTSKKVNPRESLLEIAYRKNYLDADPILKIYKEAATKTFPTLFKMSNILSINWPSLSDPRNWTKENLEKTLGIHFPADLKEDALHKDPHLIHRISAGKMGTSWTFTGLNISPLDLDSLISTNARRVFATIVVDYWIKRQHILEGPVLDAVIEAASREALKDEATSNPHKYKQYYTEFLRRARLLDEKVWAEMADSVIPNYSERHSQKRVARHVSLNLPDPKQVTNRELLTYDPGPKYPITKKYILETRDDLKMLIRLMEWLNKQPADRGPMIISETNFVDGETRRTFVELSEADVKERVDSLMEKLADKLFEFEKCYDSIMAKVKSAESFVFQGDGYSLKPKFHLILNPSKGLKHDLTAADRWLKAYKQELANTEYDIAQYLRDRREKKGIAWVEDLVRRWTGYTYNAGKETDAAHYHPRWSYLLRLRFQIRKLKNIKKVLRQVSRAEFIQAVHKRMKLHDRPIEVPDLSYYNEVSTTPTVGKWIDKTIQEMEDEYDQIIVGVDTTFEIHLDVKRGPTPGELQVMTYLDTTATLTLSSKKDPGIMTPGQKAALDRAIKSLVNKFRWRIYDSSGNDVYVAEIKKKDITNPCRWLYPLFQSGHFFLEFTVLGRGDIVLGQKKYSLQIRPASIEGKIKIWGDWPYVGQGGNNSDTVDLFISCCKAPSTSGNAAQSGSCISWARAEVSKIRLPSGRDQMTRFSASIDKINCDRSFLKELVDSQNMNKMYTDFQVFAKYGPTIRISSRIGREIFFEYRRSHTSGFARGRAEYGLLSIDENSPLVLYAPYEEPVNAVVTDASGDKTKAIFRIYLNGKIVAKSSDFLHKYQASILIASKGKQVIHVEAERTIKPNVKAESQRITFDPNSGKTINLQVWLPFFNKNNLKVKGCFVPSTPDSQTVQISGGLLKTNITTASSVTAGGCFLITNDHPLAQMDPVQISGLVWDSDNRVFRTRGLIQKGSPKPGTGNTLDFGNIPVYQQEVNVKPIQVKVLDWAGRVIPYDKLEVTIGDKKALWNGKSFAGSWRFTKRGEELKIKAAINMPDGKQIKEETIFTIEDSAFLKDVYEAPDPVIIKLRLFYPFSIFLTTHIEDSSAQDTPTLVRLGQAKLKGFSLPVEPSAVRVDERKAIHVNGPVPLGKLLTISASSPISQPKYEGTGSVVVPSELGAVNMEIILTPLQKAAFSIKDLDVLGHKGKGKPRAGKGMIASAVVSVGKVDVPMLSLKWIRRSDGYETIDILPVEQFKSYPVRHFFPPLVSKVKYDTLVLKVSDAAQPPQEVSAQRDFEWVLDTDEILEAHAMVANKKGENIITVGDDVNILVKIKAADDYDGPRTLKTFFRGRSRSMSFFMKKDEVTDRSLVITTKGIKPSIYSARISLFGPDDELQDTKLVRFILEKKKSPNDTGLTDVTCNSSRITIKFWDHATQDNDIVVIRIGKQWQKTVNLNGCGGPNEPNGGPCVLRDLPLPRGAVATISVTALNEGSVPPNTAALKVEGGCNPQLQHWNLKKGKSASISIHRR